MNCDELRDRMLSFPRRYLANFDHVWNWKVSVEDEVSSVLDEAHRNEMFKRLVKILPKWQTYRNGKNDSPYRTLKESLQNISGIYNEIREYSLLELDEIPINSLQHIWHELGRVKEFEGRINTNGIYYAIAACKPLLLIWGQIPAFDTKVRENFPREYGVKKIDFRMPFKQWYNAMMMISNDLNRRPECIEAMMKMSHKRYGDDKLIPYGRFIDIYYWTGK